MVKDLVQVIVAAFAGEDTEIHLKQGICVKYFFECFDRVGFQIQVSRKIIAGSSWKVGEMRKREVLDSLKDFVDRSVSAENNDAYGSGQSGSKSFCDCSGVSYFFGEVGLEGNLVLLKNW